MLHDVFPGSSEMARRMRALDWSKTPLGAVEHWPQSLRTSVSTCLDCAFPIVLWWGRELTILYNDEYRDLVGPAKHPAALGRPGAEVWAEIWDVIEPMLSQVMNTGEPTRSRDLLLHIDRGYLEEAYFSFSYSPIHGERGNVTGVFCPVIETTEKVIGERRLRTLRDLAARCKGLTSEDAAYRAATAVIASNPHDVPLALLYRVDEHRTEARLEAAIGIGHGTNASPQRVSLSPGGADSWGIGTVLQTDEPLIVTGLADLFGALPTGAWKLPPQSAMVLPVRSASQDLSDVVLVAAVSPMRALDEDYRTFFGLMATQIAAGLADAHALEVERRRAESLAELDRAKTTFFSNVSHEFRTPLTLMLAPLDDLRTSAAALAAPETAAALDIVHRNSLRLLKLVNTLLDFSRIEAGRIDARYEPVDLAAFTTELASVFRSAIERAGLVPVVECEPLPEPVYVDRDMWEKIVLNLLSNALKFTFEGEITVSLRPKGDHVELRVADTGVGIPEADLPRVFQRFHRVKHARARTHEGTGIGLALVQELAKQHGGGVTVESREGRGATFTVCIPTGTAHLPADRIVAAGQIALTGVGAQPYVEEALRWLPHDTTAPPSAALPDVPTPAVAAAAATRPRVLIADDNADMRDYVARLLGRRYRVDAVADGRAALARVQDDPPDLVLSDVMMPELDGFALLAAIRGDERGRSVPVILLSARAGEEARIEGLRAGADDYIVKPFTARELLARIDSQLELAQLRRDAEQALRHRSDQFETLFRQAPLGIYLVDADFRIREVNPVALPVFGVIPGGVIGRDAEEVIHILWEPDYADEVVRIFRATLETGQAYVATERAEFRAHRGVDEYYEWRLDRITLPDGRYGLVCYFRDISAQVRAQLAIAESERQLREADSRKDEFLALLAHELRNPLAPIRTGLELLRLSGDAPETVGRVRSMMERQVTQMVRLIDDLLDVSRITSGKIVLQRRPTSLADLVQSAIEAQRAAIEAGGIVLHTQLPSEGCVVDVDPTRLVQILSNVLHNASKFTPPGGRIRVGADVLTLAPPTGCEVAITVSDTGIGISDDVLPRIFELFTQGDTPADRAQSGLGIGLALAKRLIEMHGGRITAHSDGPGHGSRFVMHLPLSSTLPAAAAPPATTVPRVRSRVLIVDDNRDAAVALSLFVQELGGAAVTAHDGASGLAAVEEFKPDIVFLDIGMPGLDGYEVCRRIRQMPSQRQVMIVAVTGWGQAQDKRRAFEAGFDTHLTKPVDPDTLAQLLAGATI